MTNVLERGNHELALPGKGTFKLTVKLPPEPNEVHDASKEKISAKESKSKEPANEPDASEDTQISLNKRSGKMEDIPKQCENIPPLVAFENLKANVTDITLTLLVESISGLSSDDFEVEVIRDFDVGVVTFRKYIDAMKFVQDCAMHHSVTQLQLSPRLLEMTKIIRVENLPPGVDSYDLKCLFENPQSGGGRVVSIECFPEESSALIEFFDRKVLDTIMTKELDLNNMPLSVFPYYTSLGTALYGKEKPLIKLPAPFKESLDHSLWKFLHKRNHLIEEINEEVRRSHSELTWSPLNGEVTIRPAATLVNQGRRRIKNWKKDASTAFFGIRSRFKVTPFKVDPVVWDVIKYELEDERISIEFDTDLGIVTLVGKSEDVQNIEPQIKELIENATQKIKREEQSLKEKVAISPRKYSLLCHSGVQECLRREFPEMEIFYDRATQHMCFKGLGIHVYKAKCEVQDKVYTMVQKSIQLPPEVLQFLQQVDCSELSQSLLIAQKILAVYELEGTTVFLTGCSSEVLLKAEKQMVSALSYKRIDIEDREFLNSKKWKAITNNLPKKHNSSSKTVTISELTSGTTAEVIIAGCVREVNEIYHILFDFVEKNMKIERFLEVKPPLVIDYLKAEKKLFLQKIKMNKLKVQVDFNSRNKLKGILLTGSKAEVLEGMNILKQARASVCVKSISIDKPGASQSFRDKPWYYKREVRSFGCFVELLQNEGKKEGGGSDGQTCSCRTELAPGVSLIVQQGDLTRFPVEVVVNAAKEDLRLSGGLAAALSKAAGPELQADCDRIVKEKGKIPTGHVTISKPGKLPYHQVIHAVGPKWNSSDVLGCMLQLKNAVKRSLHLADNFQYQSIAIPAISSGDGGFPLSQCVETIVLAIKETFQYNWAGCTLKEVYLVDLAVKTVEAFAETVKTVFKNNKPGTASLPSVPAGVQPGPRNTDGNRQMLLCPGGLRILLVKGDVQYAMTDVIVNSIPRDLNLNSGPLSQALLAKAGPNLQKELNAAAQGIAVDVGTILQTTGQSVSYQVLHVVAPNWNNGNTSSLKIMQDIIRKCLEITENMCLNTITFPAIGTGNLGFPKTVFAELIISEVFKFSSNNQPTALQEVCFLLHPSDHGNIQAFSDEFDRRANGNSISDRIPKAQNTQGLYGTVISPASGVHEMKIGPITFQVATGDIAKEAADVIVNSTTKTFDHKAGVSKAILEKAGQNVEIECSRLAQQHNNGYIITDGGSLNCKNIIHVAGDADVKRSVTCVLQECEKRNHSTICLPAIGTGRAQQDPDKVAEAILDAIEDFIQKGLVRSMKKVKVVIFQPQIMDVFCANMRKREGSQAPSQSIISKIACLYGTVTSPASGVHEMKIGPITFQVATGDIAKEAADVIVNSTTKTFDHKAGVSKAILEKAGQNVEIECSRLAQQHNNGYIITDGGSLKCKNIIHVAGDADVKRSVTCVLQECEKRNHSTICLPAIGTGRAQQDPDKVAEAMMDAIEDFIQKGLVRSVKKVKVVIFQPQIMDVFFANMKKREGSQAPSQSIMSKIASFLGFSQQPPPKRKPLVLEKKTESAIFQMCGENETCVEHALSCLQNLMEKEQSLYTSEEECIRDFDEKEYQELNKLQKDLNILVELDHQKPLIKVSGISRDVEQARNAIEEMIKTVRSTKEQESIADYITEFVEWQYDDNNTFRSFDKITNMKLEEARKKQGKTVNVLINNQNYTVDMKTCIATGANGHSLQIQRITKPQVEIPGHWSDMKQQRVCLVELQPGQSEYSKVADAFNQTCSQFKIEKIERIQNRSLWQFYQTKKKTMDDKNGHIQNERLLFHGTDADSLPHVNQHGFNRSYAGKNAVAYGRGTYFAVHANYSANDTYSRPDANGKKHMYYVRVLTGLYARGNFSLLEPPPKNPQNPLDLYDTVTDRVSNPSLFVVFYDYQAYPEYLITFKR
ncbi:protein mono-ADP-ribosyltransferase PARP14-like isoform X2 [Myotis yumanensis]|uniref:protein mono-ADP-ribosyltransferase PARP14-like isoform X2 n=1 Tax=Myotis yumanensis TaxID=159337 RepID=UPI0038D02C82